MDWTKLKEYSPEELVVQVVQDLPVKKKKNRKKFWAVNTVIN